ncbi:MAG: hypothetical protein ACRDUB_01810, partial [Mycobacterium sp.]
MTASPSSELSVSGDADVAAEVAWRSVPRRGFFFGAEVAFEVDATFGVEVVSPAGVGAGDVLMPLGPAAVSADFVDVSESTFWCVPADADVPDDSSVLALATPAPPVNAAPTPNVIAPAPSQTVTGSGVAFDRCRPA